MSPGRLPRRGSDSPGTAALAKQSSGQELVVCGLGRSVVACCGAEEVGIGSGAGRSRSEDRRPGGYAVVVADAGPGLIGREEVERVAVTVDENLTDSRIRRPGYGLP